MKKQFSKEDFVDIINKLKVESDTISKLYEDFDVDIIGCVWLQNDASVIKLLEFIFDDEDKWIDWWCWENDFGRDRLEAFIDDKAIILDTAEDLYEFLIKE